MPPCSRLKQPSLGHGHAEQHFSGHLFRVSHLYLMLLRDHITNDIRMTFITHRTDLKWGLISIRAARSRARMPHNVTMEGHVFGVDGHKSVSLRRSIFPLSMMRTSSRAR